MVLPGRNPVVLAKELATLDRLSNGRLLPAFGLGVADPHEQQAFGVERERAGRDGSTRRWRCSARAGRGEPFTHHGARYHYDDLRVLPAPQQAHIDVWLGGIAPSELRRVGRLADGWLPSFVTPDDAARGREVIEADARRARSHDRRRPLRRADPVRVRPGAGRDPRRPRQAPPRPRRPVGADPDRLGRAAHDDRRASSPSAPPSSSSCRSSSPRTPTPGSSTSRRPPPSCCRCRR